MACLNILNMKAASVGDALEILSDVRHTFRCNYRKALAAVTDRPAETIVCTIYNRIPGISERALTALALFNEIILEEAALHGLPVLDLRAICTDATDYSPISPIEPSRQGGQKIARAICELLETDMRPARAGFD